LGSLVWLKEVKLLIKRSLNVELYSRVLSNIHDLSIAILVAGTLVSLITILVIAMANDMHDRKQSFKWFSDHSRATLTMVVLIIVAAVAYIVTPSDSQAREIKEQLEDQASCPKCNCYKKDAED